MCRVSSYLAFVWSRDALQICSFPSNPKRLSEIQSLWSCAPGIRPQAQNKAAAKSRRTSRRTFSCGPGGYIATSSRTPAAASGRTTSTTPRTRTATVTSSRAKDRGTNGSQRDPRKPRSAAGECDDGHPRPADGGDAGSKHAACQRGRHAAAAWGSWPVTGQRYGLSPAGQRRAVTAPLRQQLKQGNGC